MRAGAQPAWRELATTLQGAFARLPWYVVATVLIPLCVGPPSLAVALLVGTQQPGEPLATHVICAHFIGMHGCAYLAILLVLRRRVARRDWSRELWLDHLTLRDLVQATGLAVVLTFFAVGLLQIISAVYAVLEVQPPQDPVLSMLDPAEPLLLVVLILAAVVVAPIVEELTFRHVFYRTAERYLGRVHATWTVSLLFGLIHGSVPAVIVLSLLGVALQLIRHRTRSLWYPIIIHALFNAAMMAAQLVYLETTQ